MAVETPAREGLFGKDGREKNGANAWKGRCVGPEL